jgi:hypothetical protein
MRLSRATWFLLAIVSVFVVALVSSPALADPPAPRVTEREKSSHYLRIQRNERGDPTALQTSIVRFVPASGKGDVVVDLVGAVHIGDASYYKTMNKQFQQYDVVCYELVTKKDGPKVPPKKGEEEADGTANDSVLSTFINMAWNYLALESQTKSIDYTKDNFVHADMTWEEMAEAIRKRGDDGLTIMLSVAADFLRQQNLQSMKKEEGSRPTPKHMEEFDPLTLLLDPNGSVKVKRMIAENFDVDDITGGLGTTLNTILIKDRNKAALKVFQQQLVQGKKRIAIFYGAAHMPDMEEHLVKDFGLKRQGIHWLTAWDLRLRGEGMQDLFPVPEKK